MRRMLDPRPLLPTTATTTTWLYWCIITKMKTLRPRWKHCRFMWCCSVLLSCAVALCCCSVLLYHVLYSMRSTYIHLIDHESILLCSHQVSRYTLPCIICVCVLFMWKCTVYCTPCIWIVNTLVYLNLYGICREYRRYQLYTTLYWLYTVLVYQLI